MFSPSRTLQPNVLARLYPGLFVVLCLFAIFNGSGCSCNKKKLSPGEKTFAEGLNSLYLGDTTKAQQLFAEAQKAEPERPWIKLGKARQIETYSEPLQAAWIYSELVTNYSEFDSGYTGLCRLALERGKDVLAQRTLERYTQAKSAIFNATGGDTSGAGVNRSLILSRMNRLRGEVGAARRIIEPLIVKLPKDARLQLELAQILASQNKSDSAVSYAETALGMDDEDRDIQLGLLDFYASLGDAVKFGERLAALDKMFPEDFGVARRRIETLVSFGYIEFARAELSRQSGRSLPEGLRLYLNAMIAEASGEIKRANTLYELAFEKNPRDIEYYRIFARLGIAYRNSVQIEDNFELVRAYASKQEVSSDFLFDLEFSEAEMLLQVSSPMQAFTHAAQADSLFHDSPRYLALRANLFATAGAMDSMQVTLDKASKFPRTQQLLLGLAPIYARMKQDSIATKMYYESLLDSPGNFPALRGLASLAQLQGDTAGYRQKLEDLAKNYPLSVIVRRELMNYQLSVGNPRAALAIVDEIIKLRPGDIRSYELGATLALRAGEGARVQTYYEAAHTANPNIPRASFLLAKLAYETGQKIEAEKYLAEAIDADSLYIPAVVFRGVIAENDGQIDVAKAVYQSVIDSLDPFYGEAHNRMAWLMATNNMNAEQAANIARMGISLADGADANMFTTLGWCYHKQKRYDLADTEFQRSLQMAPGDAFTEYLAGVNADLWGRPELAREHLTNALALGLADVHRTDAESLLKKIGAVKS